MKPLTIKEKSRFRFAALLLWFLIFYLISPLLPGFTGTLSIQLTFSIMLILTVFTLHGNKWIILSALFVALASSSANAYNLYHDTFWTEFWALLTSLVFVTFVTVYLFRDVFLVRKVEADLVFGAICVYILLAVLWALYYALIELVSPGSFENILPAYETGNLTEEYMALKFHAFLYYSFVTQTTLGYGDITPLTPFAKNNAALQATMGVFYLATLVGGMISMLITREKIKSEILKIEKDSRH